MKYCTKCETMLDASLFYKNKDGSLVSICKQCRTDGYRTPMSKLRRIYQQQKIKSRRYGYVPPNYSVDEFLDKFIEDVAYIHLHKEWAKGGYNRKESPSISRIDSTKPFTLDNLQVVTAIEHINYIARNIRAGEKTRKKLVPVSQYDLEGNYIASYISIMDAERQTGVNSGHISRVVKGSGKTAGGFIWAEK